MFNSGFINTFSEKQLTLSVDKSKALKHKHFYDGAGYHSMTKKSRNNSSERFRKSQQNRKLRTVDVYKDVDLIAKDVPLKTWCEENGVNYRYMCTVARGERKSHKGYQCRYTDGRDAEFAKADKAPHYIEHNLVL